MFLNFFGRSARRNGFRVFAKREVDALVDADDGLFIPTAYLSGIDPRMEDVLSTESVRAFAPGARLSGGGQRFFVLQENATLGGYVPKVVDVNLRRNGAWSVTPVRVDWAVSQDSIVDTYRRFAKRTAE